MSIFRRKQPENPGHSMPARMPERESIIRGPEPGKLKDERLKDIESALGKALQEKRITPEKHKEMLDNLTENYATRTLVYYWGEGQEVFRNSTDKVPIGAIESCFRLDSPGLDMKGVMQKVEEAMAGNLNMYLVQKNGIADLLFVKPASE